LRHDSVDLDQPFLFITGSGRSGTTLLRSMFDSHPDMAIPGESGFLWQRYKHYERAGQFDKGRFATELTSHRRFRRWGLDADRVVAELSDPAVQGLADAVRCVFRMFADDKGKERYGDKTPGHILRLPLLAQYFPEARFVHLIRDGRNVALSYLDIDEWGSSSVAEAAINWRKRVLKGRRDGMALGPERYQEVRYEHLVENPEKELRRLCEFADLEFHPSMLRYFERAPEVLTTEVHPHRHQGLHRPPTKGMRDWRKDMGDAEVARFEAIAGGALTEFQYPRRFEHVAASARARATLEVSAARLRLASKYVSAGFRRLQGFVRSDTALGRSGQS